jgi:uncharacterized membrane protein
MKMIGILLILIGAVALVYQGFTYKTHEKVVDIGPVEVTKETQKSVPLPPILGGMALVGGIALLVMDARKS